MINIHQLESRWLRYKIKSYLPYLFFSITIVIIGGVFIYFNDSMQSFPNDLSIKSQQNSVVASTNILPIEKKAEITQSKKQSEILQKEPLEKTIQTSKVSLEPSLNFIDSIQENTPRYYNENIKQPVAKVDKTDVKTKKPLVSTKVQPIAEPVKQNVVSNTTMKIDRKNTQDDIDHVLARFKKSNNPALSLFIAKKYYELQDYKQAYNYALITNGINSEIDQSWVIFAKSMYKLGQKEKAISVLKKYITKSNSASAKILLKNIRAGKI